MFLCLCVLWAKKSIRYDIRNKKMRSEFCEGAPLLACFRHCQEFWGGKKWKKTSGRSAYTHPPLNGQCPNTGTTFQTGAALSSRQSGSICCSGLSEWLCCDSCCSPALHMLKRVNASPTSGSVLAAKVNHSVVRKTGILDIIKLVLI